MKLCPFFRTVGAFFVGIVTAILGFFAFRHRIAQTAPKMPKPTPLPVTARRAIALGRELRESSTKGDEAEIRARIDAILADAARD